MEHGFRTSKSVSKSQDELPANWTHLPNRAILEGMKAQLIYNPVAGLRDAEQDLRQAIAFLEGRGWQVTMRRTLGRGDAITYAREAAASGCDIVIAAGGDGTLGEVATGLVGTNCLLGVLPVGTGNVWAHMVRLPVWSPTYRTALLDAAHILVSGQERLVDVGRAGERYFVLWCGIGFDAAVARTVEPHREIRRSLGNITYVVMALAQSLSMRGIRATVVVDGKAVRARVLMVVVSNARLYGPSWELAPLAQLDDGLVEVYIFRGGSTLDIFRHFATILLGKHHQNPRVEWYRARTVEVKGERPLPVHLDGDPAGYTPVTITVVPKALRVILPEHTTPSLFQGEHVAEAEHLSLGARLAQYLAQQRDYWRGEGEKLRADLGRRLGLPYEGDEK